MGKIIRQFFIINSILAICSLHLLAQTAPASSVQAEIRNIKSNYRFSEEVAPTLVNTGTKSIYINERINESSQILTHDKASKSWQLAQDDVVTGLRCGNELETFKEIKPNESFVLPSINYSLLSNLKFRQLNKAIYKFSITYYFDPPQNSNETFSHAVAESISFTFKTEEKIAKK